ncbi:hypothetical protein PMALA_032600 [Plasmodium malariae]|uniref:Uncharacterized protein n=1 Tax=Plasmodium malariae TaxID=5858 RepID=A0A1A8WJ96_PLAMA|nr:hypothetical protein PMALA_032600 [Plasmodium malariae]
MKKEITDCNKLPNKEMNNFRLMTQLIELKKHKKAYKICEQILKKYPKNGETLAVKGYLLNLMDEKNKVEAFKLIKEGIINNLSSSFCWYLYGCLYKTYKNYDEALKCYMKSLQLNKYDYKALKETCILLLYLQRYEQFKDIRVDIYNDTSKSVRDKSILIFSFHLLKQYEKCLIIIKQVEKDLLNDSEVTNNEKHDILTYMAEILLEGKMYKECLSFLKTYEKEFKDMLWYNQIVALGYLYENNFYQANLFFKKAFSLNYENLNILLLILYTENDYYVSDAGVIGSSARAVHSADYKVEGMHKHNESLSKGSAPLNKQDTPLSERHKRGKALSSLFYLDYKDEHKMNEKLNVDKDVKVLLHEFILDIYGSNRNLKLLTKVEKNILNDYICYNLDMKKYDIYTISEFYNFINLNIINENHFKEGLDSENMDSFINTLRENVKEETNKKNVSSSLDVYSYNNIHWCEHFGVDLLYNHKRRFEKCMNSLHFYKVKNLNKEEEELFEKYFTSIQKIYRNSNLVKIFPLYFYNEEKFAYHAEKILRTLCFQKCLTVFSYFKPLFTYKNIKIMLFLLHKYVEHYDQIKQVCAFEELEKEAEMDGGKYEEKEEKEGDHYDNRCNLSSNSVGEKYDKEERLNQEKNNEAYDNFEKREFIVEENENNHVDAQETNERTTSTDRCNQSRIECNNNDYMNKGRNENIDNMEVDQICSNPNNKRMENVLEDNEEIKGIIGMSTPLGMEKSKKLDRGEDEKKNCNNDKKKKEIKLDLKKKILTKEEKNEYFILCIYSFISQIYDYINCTEEALTLINKCINIIRYKINEPLKYELIFIKGLIYKRNGNYLEAYKLLENCRNFNIADRYINSKTIKTCVKCGLVKDARKMASIFTNPLDNNFIKNIYDTHCFWLEYSIAQGYMNRHPNIHVHKYLLVGSDNIYHFEGDSNEDAGGGEGIDTGSDVDTHLNVHADKHTDRESCSKESNSNVKSSSHQNSMPDNRSQFNRSERKKKRNVDIQKFSLKKSILLDNDLLSKNEFNDYSKGLHLLHLGHKQFVEIHEDQICFYYYTLRKMLYRSYRHILFMTSQIFSSRFYRKFGKFLIKTLLHMYDYSICDKNDNNKSNKKKNKDTNPNQEDNEYYEHIRKDPLENAMIYMNTFLSQPNVDVSVHTLHYEIEKRTSKATLRVHIGVHGMFSFDNPHEERNKEITNKLNKLLGLNYSLYNEELLKQVRKQYMEDFVKFFNEYKKGDLRYYQSVLEMHMDNEEKIDERILGNISMTPKKNKMGRCFKFLKFLINSRKKHSELVTVIDHFKGGVPVSNSFSVRPEKRKK